MGKRLTNESERIQQKSIGFRNRQMRFIYANPEFKPDEFCRIVIDEQIKLSGQTQYLENEEAE